MRNRLSIIAAVLLILFTAAYAGEDLNKACIAISKGNFKKAEKIVQNSSEEGIDKAENLLGSYEKFSESREKFRKDKYSEKQQELQELIDDCLNGKESNILKLDEFAEQYVEEKEKEEDAEDEQDSDSPENITPPTAPNSQDEEEKDSETEALIDFFVAMSNVKEYASDKQHEELLKSELMENLKETAISKAIELEDKGKWAESYTGCYYWLNTLYEDNQEYEDKADNLLEKMTVKSSFIDSPCETAENRAEGIELIMLKRTIKVLTYTYITPLDFEKMLHAGLDRCITVAEVLSFPDEDIAVSYDRSGINDYFAGVRNIKEKYTSSILENYYHTQVFQAFNEVLALNKKTLKLPSEVLIMHFTESLLSELDPYTNIVWPFFVKEFQKSITQEFSGIGVEISKEGGRLIVNSLLPNTPAFGSGLDAEDVILEVDGVSTEGMSINCAVSKISGPEGTTVSLKVRHKGSDKTEIIKIERGRIVVPTVKGWKRQKEEDWSYLIDEENKIGLIRLTSFSEATTEQMKKAIEDMRKDALNGLILDLRYNSGGLLSTAVDIVDMFIKKGPVVSTKPRMGMPEEHFAQHETFLPDCPLVVLINEGSASASEIVSGALSDPRYERATLVGSRTFGKGSVQTVTAAPGKGAQLKYTMAFYYLPSGQPVKNRYQLEEAGRKDWGIAPDVKLEMYGSEFEDYFDVQQGNDILVQDGHVFSEEEDRKKKHSAEETVNSDPQLEMGLIVLKAKMLAEGMDVKF
ncbi:putative CtpA-like serine protease [Sedimentisphaera cyanobacteriorum]|uniref:Putative CtpA-like serine protease n=1 Tax=Sedimentisphaera cyanobacteriorum TaxID=1940790 RepID=A0A1Q2HR84_9BACT|nr:S41 family peptidase [Sedimentisphaera cyanobacteriorum]AQQ09910.1 putative CtpA-like serine protease [Sedimentisphaera cyanobacteriorum]